MESADQELGDIRSQRGWVRYRNPVLAGYTPITARFSDTYVFADFEI